jgi:DNA-binding helix-hairpin-helix protein with protein kinase domain
MTRHSSSQPGAPTVLLDSISQAVPIGSQIGRGGEGAVFVLQSDHSLVAKVYHKKPLPDEQVAKLNAMVSVWSSPLETIAAWPRSVLFDASTRKPCGILMTRMDDARPLHELYGTTNRRRHFPDVGWHHMVLAARNTAAAFQTVHAAGVLVGDVNQGNLLVDKKMCVRMIDCDSFQIASNGRIFSCPVGTPHFTPPELQSQKLREVVRTQNHDRFGLAVLIFHLLFVGRHPFAGRYRGPGDLPIEKAIAERRFAFSKNRSETLVDPPPASITLDDLPANIGALFEAAFRSPPESNARPAPTDWVQALEGLMRARKVCQFDPVHVYPANCTECPWCKIEDAGGPAFFVPASGVTTVTADRLSAYEDQIIALDPVPFPELPTSRLAIPSSPVLKTVKSLPKRGVPDWLSEGMVAAWIACFAGTFVHGMNGAITLAAGTAASFVLAGALFFSKKARERRATNDQYNDRLDKGLLALEQHAENIEGSYKRREDGFDRSNEDLRQEIHVFKHAEASLQDAIVSQRENQKSDYLRQFAIRDNFRRIPGLTPSNVAMLEAYSVETANEVEQLRLYGVPTIEPEIQIELLQWRRDVETGFKFNPDHGISLADVGAAKEAAVRRFKIQQARKILTAAKQIATQADVAADDINRSCTRFEDAAEQWKTLAKQHRDYESHRRKVERLINRNAATIFGLAAGIPFVAAIAYFLFGWG